MHWLADIRQMDENAAGWYYAPAVPVIPEAFIWAESNHADPTGGYAVCSANSPLAANFIGNWLSGSRTALRQVCVVLTGELKYL